MTKLPPDMFRVWYGGKLVYQNPFSSFFEFMVTPSGHVIFEREPGFVNGKTRDALLERWSSTKDKNDKPVYEGDIVHVTRLITHVDDDFKELWNHADPAERSLWRKRLERDGLVQTATYEEYGIVKLSTVRWSMSPYIAKTITFNNGKIAEQWVKPVKARQLRINRGLWVVEVIGNKHEDYELYNNKLALTT